MRLHTYGRAAVLLTVLLAVQGGACAMADSHDPLTPFAQGAARFADMTAPLVNAASDIFFPRG